MMVVEFSTILKPDDFWPWLSGCHTDENDFVAQYVFVIEVRGLGDASPLQQNN